MEVQVFLKCGHTLFIETDQYHDIERFFFEYNSNKQDEAEEIRVGNYQIKHSDITAVGCDYLSVE